MAAPFKLIHALFAHDGPIRCACEGPTENEIITGCQADAPNLRRWKFSKDFLEAEEIGAPIFHDHWVTAVTSLPPNSSRSVFPQGCIVSGCMDSKIRIYDLNNNLISTLVGHNKGVISFSWTKNFQLVSGSWDGTAIIWDVANAVALQSLGPHENGVHVLSLPNGLIATTSTGESVDGKPANFQIRFWNPSTGQLVGTPIQDHAGSIRSIAFLPSIEGFLTSSNDGTIMMRSIEGQPIEIFSHPVHDDGNPSFILDTCALDTSGGMDFVSGGEDGSVIVWSNNASLQSIPHPNTIWVVLGLHTMDHDGTFLTGGHDGVLRIFSQNAAILTAHASTIEPLTLNLQQEVEEVEQKKRKGPSAEELAKAPKWELRGNYPGKSENQVMVFNKDGSMIAAQWSSGAWVMIGEVTGSGDGGYIGSTYFDHVLPVEIETSNGLKNLKLGYNNAENPFVAAQRFIDQHNLGQYYLNQIADWIMSNAGKSNAATIGTGANSAVPDNARDRSRTMSTGSDFRDRSRTMSTGSYTGITNVTSTAIAPAGASALAGSPISARIESYAVFDDIPNRVKVFSKLQEFNGKNPLFSEAELSSLDHLLGTLTNTSHYHSSTVSGEEIQLVLKMLQGWISIEQQAFMAFDWLRLIALHPQGGEFLSTQSMILSATYQNMLHVARNPAIVTSTTAYAMILTMTRCLANMIRNDRLRQQLLSTTTGITLDEVLQIPYIAFQHSNKLVRFAASSVLYNVLAGVVTFQYLHHHPSLSSTTVQRMLLESYLALQREKEHVNTAYRLVAIIGTILQSIGRASFQEYSTACHGRTAIQSAISQWSGKEDRVVTQLQELIAYL